MDTKNSVFQYIVTQTESFHFAHLNYFTAKTISNKIHISRSLASQYLNDLYKQEHLIKINSRPVYFLHKNTLQKLYNIEKLDNEFYDVEEFKDYLQRYAKKQNSYQNIVGKDGSLSSVLRQLQEGFEYPPNGLPAVLYGEKGTGKKTIAQAIYKNAIRKGILSEHTKLICFDFDHLLHDEEFSSDFFESKDNDEKKSTVYLFQNVQKASQKAQTQLASFIEESKGKDQHQEVRFIFLSTKSPEECFHQRLTMMFPIILRVPTFREKSKEEKEEFVIHRIKVEGQKINKEVKISNTVLRALINGDYEENMTGVNKTIQRMLASALKKATDANEIIVHTYDLPEKVIQTLPIVKNEEVFYIDANNYQKTDEVSFILDYFERILSPLKKVPSLEGALEESKKNIDLLNEFLSYKQRIPPEKVKTTEIFLNNLLDILLKKRFINLPNGLSAMLAKLLYISDIYQSSMENWAQKKQSELDDYLLKLQKTFPDEALIINEIVMLIRTNFEVKLNDMLTVILYVSLYDYHVETSKRSVLGVIVCHGYSTATSIADAVNTLLDTYIFEAVDMPLDFSSSKINEILLERLKRMNHSADLIIMVDMGSLEQLGENISEAINGNVGVINNVSTRLALNVGEEIIKNRDIQTILSEITEYFTIDYRIFQKKQKDTILFTSESGIHMAQRMRELFENSLPPQSGIYLEICDFNRLVTEKQHHEVFEANHILFITGTTDPHIEGYQFISLEEIITSSNIGFISACLTNFMQPTELNNFLLDLKRDFTLQNVVGYLTILNPKVLLEDVMAAIDLLEAKLNTRFSGESLIGIYIHVSCLIERLVTKNAITEYEDLELFQKENAAYIQCVKESFKKLTQRYNVELPVSEIAYLHQFIVADKYKETNEEFNDEINRLGGKNE